MATPALQQIGAASRIHFQKKMAASIFKCGPSKVWLDPKNKEKISEARTRMTFRME